MIVGQDLQAWLADDPRQRATRASIEAFARNWGLGPVQRGFRDAIDSIPAPTAEKIAEAVCGLFADTLWVDAFVDGLAARMRADPFFNPPFLHLTADIHNGLLVFDHELLSIALSAGNPTQVAAKKNAPHRGPTSISFNGQLSVFKFVRAGGAFLSFWEAPPITAGFTGVDAGRCRRAGERRIEDGEILVLDGRRQSYVIEQLRSNVLVLHASITHGQAPLKVEYDSKDCAFVGCSATDDSASRIQMVTTLLRKLECDAALPVMTDLLDHPDFFVRWHVMKEMLGLDAQAALPHLKRMAAADPHPDPRRAARAVLDRLEAPPGNRQAA